MNKNYFQVIELMLKNPQVSQREIAAALSISPAYVNKIIAAMEENGFLSENGNGKKVPTKKALVEFDACKVDNAVIMAAGFGSRFVPLCYTTPKGLLEVFGERMIERQIKQLKEAGIHDITVVVGYLKESFEYLIDKYDVKLVYNPDFKTKNNLSTLYHVRHELKNTYILSSDNWLRENMYRSHEYDSWYSAVKMKGKTSEWVLKTGLNDKITGVKVGGKDDWVMYGPVFFSKDFSKKIKPLIEKAYKRDDSDDWYWEDVYMRNIKNLTMFAHKQKDNQVYEFESLDEIRLFDPSYLEASHNKWLELIAKIFKKDERCITHLKPLKFGMTNKSFLFRIENEDYIFRIPGEGTEDLINRKEEHEVYKTVAPLNLSDTVIYFDPDSGVKISKFVEGCHNADARSEHDLKLCMQAARKLHNSGLTVSHSFDFRERIAWYEKLTEKKNGIFYNDYREVRTKMDELLDMLDSMPKNRCLTHIDLIPDNLIIQGETIKLIDWEYAGMCDPLADIAMFAIYAYYDNAELEHLMHLYFEREPDREERIRIYSYTALSGFLWALWTCYKEALGISFDEYGLKMYRYAKDYYKRVKDITGTNTL